jgi:proteic killer suppression protein
VPTELVVVQKNLMSNYFSLDNGRLSCYIIESMVESFKHKGLKKYFEEGDSSKINQAHARRLRLILTQLQAAQDIRDMNFPGSNLHKLSGDREGFWSVSVSGNWRVIFRFIDGDAYDVDYLDYH